MFRFFCPCGRKQNDDNGDYERWHIVSLIPPMAIKAKEVAKMEASKTTTKNIEGANHV